MAQKTQTYFLHYGYGKQTIDMPKRAKVLSVYPADAHIAIDAAVIEDADTRAFDIKHQRYFEVAAAGQFCPEGTHVGSVSLEEGAKKKSARGFHVFEVRGR